MIKSSIENIKIADKLMKFFLIGASILTLYLFVQTINKEKEPSYEDQIAALEYKIAALEDTRPTYEKIDLMMDERSQYQSNDNYQFEDKTGGVDLSQPVKPEPKEEITYKVKATSKTVVAGDETCGTDENRLHWELFRTPAPGCENTPYKGM